MVVKRQADFASNTTLIDQRRSTLNTCTGNRTTSKSNPEEEGIVFSTDDFASCFNSPLAEFYGREIDVTVRNQTRGDFIFVGRDYSSKQKLCRCDVGVIVPDDRFILFEFLKVNLKCSVAAIYISKLTSENHRYPVRSFCKHHTADDGFDTFRFRYHAAVVSLSIIRVSTDQMMHLRFSAVVRSEEPQLQHLQTAAYKGLLQVNVSLLVVVAVVVLVLVVVVVVLVVAVVVVVAAAAAAAVVVTAAAVVVVVVVVVAVIVVVVIAAVVVSS